MDKAVSARFRFIKVIYPRMQNLARGLFRATLTSELMSGFARISEIASDRSGASLSHWLGATSLRLNECSNRTDRFLHHLNPHRIDVVGERYAFLIGHFFHFKFAGPCELGLGVVYPLNRHSGLV